MFDSLISLVLFTVHKSESQRVRKWLEEVHYPHMYATGCFEQLRLSALDERDAEKDIFVYVHSFKSAEESWRYKEEHRPGLVQEFGGELGALVAKGILSVTPLIGQSVMHEYGS